MIVEKSFKKAVLTNQTTSSVNGQSTLEIIRHPVITGCCILSILQPINESNHASLTQITVNIVELKRVSEMLCGIGV